MSTGSIIHLDPKRLEPAAEDAIENRPEPLEDSDVQPFPVEVFPEWWAQWVWAVAEQFQVPADIPAMMSLGAVSAALSKKYRVNINGSWREHLNLFLVTLARPGEGKSPVVKLLERAFNRYERDREETTEPERIDASVRQETLKKRAAAAKAEAVRAKDDYDREDALERAKELELQLAGTAAPPVLRLRVDDITYQALASFMHANGGRAAIISPEGRVFGDLTTNRFGSGPPELDLYKKGFSNETIFVHRKGSDDFFIDAPALTIAVACQPVVLESIIESDRLIGEGVTDRFLYSYPLSRIGHRKPRGGIAPESVTKRFDEVLLRLLHLDPKTDPQTGELVAEDVLFSPDATDSHFAMRAEYEPRLASDLRHGAGYVSKLYGIQTRLAGILAFADAEGKPERVERDHSERARLLVDSYFLPHWERVFASVKDAKKNDDLIYILSKCKLVWDERDEGRGYFTVRDVTHRTSKRLKKRVSGFLEQLVGSRHLERHGQGFRPVPGAFREVSE